MRMDDTQRSSNRSISLPTQMWHDLERATVAHAGYHSLSSLIKEVLTPYLENLNQQAAIKAEYDDSMRAYVNSLRTDNPLPHPAHMGAEHPTTYQHVSRQTLTATD